MTAEELVVVWERWDAACPEEDRRLTRRRTRALKAAATRRGDTYVEPAPRAASEALGVVTDELEAAVQAYCAERALSPSVFRHAVAQLRRDGLSPVDALRGAEHLLAP